MRIGDLKQISREAPSSGQMLAYTRKQVYFRKYGKLEEVYGLLDKEELLELHLFDDNREYRAIWTQSKQAKYKSQVIEYCTECCKEFVDNELSNERTSDNPTEQGSDIIENGTKEAENPAGSEITGEIRHLAQDCYPETILLDRRENDTYYLNIKKSSKTKPVITVLNHIAYDDNGLAYIDDYRLRMGGELV